MPKTPQEIVGAAYKYMMDVMNGQASRVSNPRVEEVVPSGDGGWNVVLSYDVTGEFAFDKTREYKQFRVNSEGQVLEMRIKQV